MQGQGRYGKNKFMSVVRNKKVQKIARGVGRAVGHTYRSAAEEAVGSALGLPPGALAGVSNPAFGGQGAYYGSRRGLGGMGSYTTPYTSSTGAPFINHSESITAGQHFTAPKFSSGKISHDSGGMQMQHQEYVQTIYGNPIGTKFTSITYNVNPGLAEVFPMMSQFANNFENYKMDQCVFHYETLLDEGVFQSSTGQVGDILMYSHLNPDTPELQNVSEFIQAGGHISRTTKGCMSGVECDPKQLKGLPNADINRIRYFPRDDTNEYDQAKFQIAVSNTPDTLAGQPIGRLYVSYTVKLIKPRLSQLLGRGQLVDQFAGKQVNKTVAKDQPITMLAEANKWVGSSANNIGCKLEIHQSAVNDQNRPAIKITLPNWLQGTVELRLELNQAIKSPSEAINGAGNSYVPPHHWRVVKDIIFLGNIKPDNGMLGFTEDDEECVGFANLNNMGTISLFNGTNGSVNHVIYGTYTQRFKVSLPNESDNAIILELNQSTNTTTRRWWSKVVDGQVPLTLAEEFIATHLDNLQIRTVQDFGLVGDGDISQLGCDPAGLVLPANWHETLPAQGSVTMSLAEQLPGLSTSSFTTAGAVQEVADHTHTYITRTLSDHSVSELTTGGPTATTTESDIIVSYGRPRPREDTGITVSETA